jgi:hypothetical protein
MAQPDAEKMRGLVRRFVLKRARELDLMSLIPENWDSDGSLKT